jgi:hypothetical protein
MPLREFVSAGGELIIHGAAHLKNSPTPHIVSYQDDRIRVKKFEGRGIALILENMKAKKLGVLALGHYLISKPRMGYPLFSKYQ